MTTKSELNKEILRLALPSILANITIPLVGMVGTGIAGHLPSDGTITSATFIGAMSVGAMLFNLLYWNFFFLRTGTGGLTAQAFGRGDMHECAKIFARGIMLAMIVAVATLALQWPYVKAALWLLGGSPEVESLAERYFYIRIWAAPATLSLMAFSGWFVGMQDSFSSMWKDLIVNGVNIVASYILAMGVGTYEGMGFPGIALGTVIAQYSGLVFCILVCVFKYGKKVFSHFHLSEIPQIMRGSEIRCYMKMNMDLMWRSVGFTAIYIGFTMIAACYGDLMLACSSIMMQLLMLFSYFTDGFSYAGEALVGRFIGERNNYMLKETIRYIFLWNAGISFLFIGIYWVTGIPLMTLFTDDASVVDVCSKFLPWLVAMPPMACVAFTWDGLYLGATAARPIRNAMTFATLAFFGTWFALRYTVCPEGETAIHLLLLSYFMHLVARTIYLSHHASKGWFRV